MLVNRSLGVGIKSDVAWVYFLQSSAPPHLVKIGRTIGKPSSRISSLQVGSPVELNTVLLLRGSILLEGLIHLTFSRLNERGEWFRAQGDLARFIKRCRSEDRKTADLRFIQETIVPLIHPDDRATAAKILLAFEVQEAHDRWRFPYKFKDPIAKPASSMVGS